MSLMIVDTKYGKLEGKAMEDYTVFRGVPYAAPPVGELRWKKPQPPASWEGVRQAVEFAPGCPQVPHEPDSFYYREFYSHGRSEKSEDCLYLNVYTPAKSAGEKLPVLFWIHGGAFTHGWSNEIEFDGARFCELGVILVTINYRVGLFGFLSHPLLHGEDLQKLSGNYGLYDQIAALQWVHDNIDGFGGDPEKVTIFGQSAGAMSVQVLCSTSLTKGLFRGAILQSGLGLNRGLPLEQAEKINASFMEKAGICTREELYSLSEEKLVRLIQSRSEENPLAIGPVIDGVLLTDSYNTLIRTGQIADISYIIGSTAQELGEDFAQAVFTGAEDWAQNQLSLGRKPVWLYYFDRQMPGDGAGAFHSAELWHVFGTYEKCWRPLTEDDALLSREMSAYWANFAKNLDPNGEGLPQWTPYTLESKKRLRLGLDTKMDQVVR